MTQYDFIEDCITAKKMAQEKKRGKKPDRDFTNILIFL